MTALLCVLFFSAGALIMWASQQLNPQISRVGAGVPATTPALGPSPLGASTSGQGARREPRAYGAPPIPPASPDAEPWVTQSVGPVTVRDPLATAARAASPSGSGLSGVASSDGASSVGSGLTQGRAR